MEHDFNRKGKGVPEDARDPNHFVSEVLFRWDKLLLAKSHCFPVDPRLLLLAVPEDTGPLERFGAIL